MIRVALTAAAVAVAGMAVPAGAATIVQTDSEFVSRGFEGFNTSLGRLDRVLLHIEVEKTRGWRADIPTGSPLVRTIQWNIIGPWNGPLPVQLTGTGSATVVFDDAVTTQGNRDYAYFTVLVTGSADGELDVSRFVNVPSRIYLDGFDPGYFDTAGSDTLFTANPDVRFSRVSGQCVGPSRAFMEDDCGRVFYRLTYDYTTALTLSGVPEPATWAMMIAGFGMIGGAMRRRSTKIAFA